MDRDCADGDEAIASVARRASELRHDLRFLLRGDDESFVYYLEHRGHGTFLRASPVDVSRIVRDALFDRFRTVVLTSATLAVEGSFDYIKGRLGIGAADGTAGRVGIRLRAAGASLSAATHAAPEIAVIRGGGRARKRSRY